MTVYPQSDCAMSRATHSGAYHFASIITSLRSSPRARLGLGLVVGYGEGHEASFLSCCLGVPVLGIDLRPPAEIHREKFWPVLANALRIPFPTNSFDFVFSYHVLEHLPDPGAGLAEMNRVLRWGGYLYIGTPNRQRVVGYIGSYGATVYQKAVWNLKDYIDRLHGRFTNDMGAHAGFSRWELRNMLIEHFSEVRWLTREYLWFRYSKKIPAFILRALLADPVLDFIAPSLYALCRK